MHPVIHFKTDGVTFYIDLQKRFTKLSDNSGTGKTYLCNALISSMKVSKDLGITPVMDIDSNNPMTVIIVNGTERTTETFTERNTLFIIDEADILFTQRPDLIQNILENETSYFLIIARAVNQELTFDYTERAKLKRDANDKIISLRYSE